MAAGKNATNSAAAPGVSQQVGYARVSTSVQDLALQLDALTAAGCDPIYRDVGSGSIRHRPQLDKCLEYRGDGLAA